MATVQKTDIPAVPVKTPFFNQPKDDDFSGVGTQRWSLNRVWIIFFERLAKFATQQAKDADYDKVTFGLVAPLAVQWALTNYYICRNAGTFVDFEAKIRNRAPVGADAILDVSLSTDDGVTWASIFPPGGRITLPAGSTSLVRVSSFAITSIAVDDLLRIDCIQTGTTEVGRGIQVTGRWSLTS